MGMNNAEGISEKTSVSNWMVKSNPSRQLSTVGPRELSLLQVENNMLGWMLQDEKQDGPIESPRGLLQAQSVQAPIYLAVVCMMG